MSGLRRSIFYRFLPLLRISSIHCWCTSQNQARLKNVHDRLFSWTLVTLARSSLSPTLLLFLLWGGVIQEFTTHIALHFKFLAWQCYKIWRYSKCPLCRYFRKSFWLTEMLFSVTIAHCDLVHNIPSSLEANKKNRICLSFCSFGCNLLDWLQKERQVYVKDLERQEGQKHIDTQALDIALSIINV